MCKNLGVPKISKALQNTETLRKIAAHIAETGKLLTATADGMTECGFSEMMVENYKSLTLGIKNLDAFDAAVRNAFTDTREGRSDFRAGEVIETYKSRANGNGKPRRSRPKKTASE